MFFRQEPAMEKKILPVETVPDVTEPLSEKTLSEIEAGLKQELKQARPAGGGRE